MATDDLKEFNKRLFYEATNELKRILDSAPDLATALEWFDRQQLLIGFIRDDLSRVHGFRCCCEEDDAHFYADFNGGRRDRSSGAGRRQPPPGVTPSNSGCFLDLENIWWMQSGVQLPYIRTVGRQEACFLVNPFPIARPHCTVTSVVHKPQAPRTEDEYRARLEEIYALAAELPHWLICINYEGAGASIPGHAHGHCLKRPAGRSELPAQRAIHRTAVSEGDKQVLCVSERYYPLPVFRINGSRANVVDETLALAMHWRRVANATDNVIALTENGQVAFYYVPRDRTLSRAPGFAGELGSLELMGWFIFSAESEEQALRDRRIDYRYLWRVLRDVRPPLAVRPSGVSAPTSGEGPMVRAA